MRTHINHLANANNPIPFRGFPQKTYLCPSPLSFSLTLLFPKKPTNILVGMEYRIGSRLPSWGISVKKKIVSSLADDHANS